MNPTTVTAQITVQTVQSNPIQNANVSAFSITTHALLDTQLTDASGVANLQWANDNLTTFSFVVTKTGFISNSSTGGHGSHTLRMSSGLQMTVTVVDFSNSPLSGATVMINDSNGILSNVTSNSSGLASLTWVDDGQTSFTLQVQKPGYTQYHHIVGLGDI